MKTDFTIIENQSINHYLDIMKNIEFMHTFIQDPDIFNPESNSFKSFLIQSFCYLHSDFHYLSYLNNEDIDLELIKAAAILQIFPINCTKKRHKLFDNMNEDDIHKFWLKFFNLFKKQKNFSTDSIFYVSWENKINFFKDIKSTLNYLNYQLPVVHNNRFNSLNVTKELENWRELKSNTLIIPDESIYFNFNDNQKTDVDVDHLITNLQQIGIMCKNKMCVHQDKKLHQVNFFTTFVNLSKNILLYKNNLLILNSRFLDKNNFQLLLNNVNVSEILYFIRKCINIVKTLKLEINSLK